MTVGMYGSPLVSRTTSRSHARSRRCTTAARSDRLSTWIPKLGSLISTLSTSDPILTTASASAFVSE